MAIDALSSGASLVASIRSQMQTAFAAARKTYQETGNVLDVSENFQSSDGNVKITLSGRTWQGGEKSLDFTLSMDGAESEAVQRYIIGGIDDVTGLPMPADTRYGGSTAGGGSSEDVKNVADIDAFEKTILGSFLQTQDEMAAKTKYQIGDRVVSREESQAHNRKLIAVWDRAEAIADSMDFKNEQDRADFYVKLGNAMVEQSEEGGSLDLAGLFKGISSEQLAKGVKGLKELKGNDDSAIQRLIATLTSYVDQRKSEDSARHPRVGRSVNLVL